MQSLSWKAQTQDFFQFLVDKFVAKIAGWKKKLLSEGGHLILSSIPLQVLSIMDPPKAVSRRLEKIMANFFWGE